jgi:ankyrin repeat protein
MAELEERAVLRKDQLEITLGNENLLIKEGTIKDDNPLDLSEPFRELCSACRKGDLKVCQEKITEGVNVNARDAYDYTPLILVSLVNGRTLYIVRFNKQELNTLRPGESLRAL